VAEKEAKSVDDIMAQEKRKDACTVLFFLFL